MKTYTTDWAAEDGKIDVPYAIPSAYPSAGTADRPGHDLVINSESRTYLDGDTLVSILSVHSIVCPLIRAELRGDDSVRVLIYYHARTRLGLQAYEATLRDDPAVIAAMGLAAFVRDALNQEVTGDKLADPYLRELYLHEVIRRLAQPIATHRLISDDTVTFTRII